MEKYEPMKNVSMDMVSGSGKECNLIRPEIESDFGSSGRYDWIGRVGLVVEDPETGRVVRAG